MSESENELDSDDQLYLHKLKQLNSTPEQTLTSIVMEAIASNLNYYLTQQKSFFLFLPSILKHKLFTIVARDLTCKYRDFLEKDKFEEMLEFFANNITDTIYLQYYVTDQLLEKLTLYYTNLKEVDFPTNMPRYKDLYDSDSDEEEDEPNKDLTKLGLMKFLITTPKLEELIFFHETKVTDDVLILMAKNCKHLKNLDVQGCPVTDRGIAFLRNLSIEKLNLAETRISNAGLRILVGGKCGKTLKELEVNDCRNVTFNGVKSVANRCDLKKLSFKKIGDIVSISQLKFKHQPKYAEFTKPEYYAYIANPPSDEDGDHPELHDVYYQPVQYVRWNSKKNKWDTPPE